MTGCAGRATASPSTRPSTAASAAFCRRGQINLCDNRRVLGRLVRASTGSTARSPSSSPCPQHILYRAARRAGLRAGRDGRAGVDRGARRRAGRRSRWATRRVVVGAGMIGLLMIQALAAGRLRADHRRGHRRRTGSSWRASSAPTRRSTPTAPTSPRRVAALDRRPRRRRGLRGGRRRADRRDGHASACAKAARVDAGRQPRAADRAPAAGGRDARADALRLVRLARRVSRLPRPAGARRSATSTPLISAGRPARGGRGLVRAALRARAGPDEGRSSSRERCNQ